MSGGEENDHFGVVKGCGSNCLSRPEKGGKKESWNFRQSGEGPLSKSVSGAHDTCVQLKCDNQ